MTHTEFTREKLHSLQPSSWVNSYTHTQSYKQVHKCACAHAHACASTHTHTHTQSYKQVHKCACAHTHTRARARAHTHNTGDIFFVLDRLNHSRFSLEKLINAQAKMKTTQVYDKLFENTLRATSAKAKYKKKKRTKHCAVCDIIF